MLLVRDIFYSIQGESSFAGYPCKFVRLGGCNLKCSYCDTKETQTIESSKKLSIGEIVNNLSAIGAGVKLVEITGGEPLIQEGVYGLFNELIKLGYTVLLETNGTIDLKNVPKKVIKIVDIKCPSSGYYHKNNYENLAYISTNDELKFVIGGDEDYIFAKEFLNGNAINTSKIIFSAVEPVMSSKALGLKILKDGLNIRLGLQIHKILQLK